MTKELETLKELMQKLHSYDNDITSCPPEYEYYQGFNDAFKLVNSFYINKLEEELEHIREGR